MIRMFNVPRRDRTYLAGGAIQGLSNFADAFGQGFMRAVGQSEQNRLQLEAEKRAEQRQLGAETRQRDFMRERSIAESTSPEQFLLRGGKQWDQLDPAAEDPLIAPPKINPQYKILEDSQRQAAAAAAAAAQADRELKLQLGEMDLRGQLGAANIHESGANRRQRIELGAKSSGDIFSQMPSAQTYTGTFPALPGAEPLFPGMPGAGPTAFKVDAPTTIEQNLARARQLAGASADSPVLIPKVSGPAVNINLDREAGLDRRQRAELRAKVAADLRRGAMSKKQLALIGIAEGAQNQEDALQQIYDTLAAGYADKKDPKLDAEFRTAVGTLAPLLKME